MMFVAIWTRLANLWLRIRHLSHQLQPLWDYGLWASEWKPAAEDSFGLARRSDESSLQPLSLQSQPSAALTCPVSDADVSLGYG